MHEKCKWRWCFLIPHWFNLPNPHLTGLHKGTFSSLFSYCGNIYSPSTLLGTPVHLLSHAIVRSASHGAAIRCIRQIQVRVFFQFKFTLIFSLGIVGMTSLKSSLRMVQKQKQCAALLWMETWERSDENGNSDNHTLYSYGEQKSSSECTTCPTLRLMGYNSRGMCQVPLLLVKNQILRLHWAPAHQNWIDESWKNVACSDKSGFLLHR